MTHARYSLIRYIPDVARGEQLNVGILAWTDRHITAEVDTAAIERVVRENPHLAKQALAGLREQVTADLRSLGDSAPAAAEQWLNSQRGYPVTATEVRQTTVSADTSEALAETVDRLLLRIVRPRRRSGGGGDAGQAVEKLLKPLVLRNRVVRDHMFKSSRTGVTRAVDYFANSTANIALDVVKLSVKSADEIVRRADAEAFKVEDILAENSLQMVVFCAVSDEETLQESTAKAEQILRSVGAHVVTDANAAANEVVRAVA